MDNLPTLIKGKIFSYIEDELLKYWKTYFSNNIIIRLNPKSYFSKNVLPEIDKGWRYVTLYTGPCIDCHKHGYKHYNTLCNMCIKSTPCINCYWYNSDPFNNNGGCYCKGIQEWVSWEQIGKYYEIYRKKYPRYYDLINSEEWLTYLENEYRIANYY